MKLDATMAHAAKISPVAVRLLRRPPWRRNSRRYNVVRWSAHTESMTRLAPAVRSQSTSEERHFRPTSYRLSMNTVTIVTTMTTKIPLPQPIARIGPYPRRDDLAPDCCAAAMNAGPPLR